MIDLAQVERENLGIRAYSCKCFVDNECDSDEYRETQPAKGLQMISELFDALADESKWHEAMTHLAAWTNVLATADFNAPPHYSYAGADELRPLLTMYHEILWDNNQHPYDSADYSYVADNVIPDFEEDKI